MTLVALTDGYFQTYRYYPPHYVGYIATVLHFTLYVVVPLVVLIVNAMLIREMRRASHNAAANLGHHQSTSSQSAAHRHARHHFARLCPDAWLSVDHAPDSRIHPAF